MGPSAESDSELRDAYWMLAREGLDMLWVGGYRHGWETIERGVPGRRMSIGYIFRHGDGCGLGNAEIRQDHINGRFGRPILTDVDGNPDGNFKYGEPIECSVADQVKFGYRPPLCEPLAEDPSGDPLVMRRCR